MTRVTITSSGPGIPSITTDLVTTNGVWGGVIGNIPTGTERAFLAQAFDSSNTLLFEGSASDVTIRNNQTTLVAITLQEVNPPPPFSNEAPILQSVVANPTTVQTGALVSLQATAEDPNPGDSITYSWTAADGVFSNASSPSTQWTAPAVPGLVTLTLTVSDSRGASSSLSFAINVVNGLSEGSALLDVRFNSWPLVSALSASETRLDVGQFTTVAVTASDSDGDALSFQWSATCAGSWTNSTSSTASFSPSSLPSGACNNCQLIVAISDGRGGQTTGTVALCVAPTPTNRFPPTLIRSYQSSLTALPSQQLTFEVTATDPQASSLTFSWSASTGTLGTPQTDATVSRIAWTAPDCVVPGASASATATVTNAYGLSTTRTFEVTGLPECATWVSTGSMLSPRLEHTATLLPNGKVLVAGGYGYFDWPTPAAEVFDPATGTWSATGSMASHRQGHSALLMPNGKVLVTMGFNNTGVPSEVEVYDPTTGSWSPTGPMVSPRTELKVTLLPNGKVLGVGGYFISEAELYDPDTSSWSAAGSLSTARYRPSVTLLPNGKVLVAAGRQPSGHPGATAEVYDPDTGSWTSTGSLATARFDHTATLLPNGKVLVAGGQGLSFTPYETAEIYDPATGTWSPTGSLATARYGHTATLLPNGKVLVAGGLSGSVRVSTAEIYDPATGTWSAAGSMSSARSGLTATLLPDGQVLITGGIGPLAHATAELYSP
ncbi:kelch repeat-containing protein [Hyalangium sp. s54d21]|uniref:Kelch repeat-containing protein n=1 Tax=Hyalangium rubrum TaxID=3103134 RepID=A0ABU5GXX3_9BACT|nr:kelch repeat-containing protein [Hyalangium sp. s54d21]MDY7225343.1 kelch repeat-containing protein [Hyalangium sp. s54d21]